MAIAQALQADLVLPAGAAGEREHVIFLERIIH